MSKLIQRIEELSTGQRRLLISDITGLGDDVMMTAITRTIRHNLPNVYLAVRTYRTEVFDHNPDVDEVFSRHDAIPPHFELIDCYRWWRPEFDDPPPFVHAGHHCFDFITARIDGINRKYKLGLRELYRRPKIFLSEEEVRDQTGMFPGSWLVSNYRRASDDTKWDARASAITQEVIDRLPLIQWVQVGSKSDELLRGVVDNRMVASNRYLFRLMHQARGILCGDTGFMHIAAALDTPAVVLVGGRLESGVFPYPYHSLFTTAGTLDCNRPLGCRKLHCCHAEDCYELIDPAEVAAAVEFHDKRQYQEARIEVLSSADATYHSTYERARGVVGQNEAEAKRTFRLIRDTQVRNVLEIGTQFAGWIRCMSGACPRGTRFLAVDKDPAPWHEEKRRLAKNELALRGQAFECITGDSQEKATIERVKQHFDSVDILHVDGDHRYKGCKKDFWNYSPLVRPGGWILMHDACNDSGDYGGCDVAKFLEELKRAGHRRFSCFLEWYESVDGSWGASSMGVAAIQVRDTRDD